VLPSPAQAFQNQFICFASCSLIKYDFNPQNMTAKRTGIVVFIKHNLHALSNLYKGKSSKKMTIRLWEHETTVGAGDKNLESLSTHL
jgi:hypothetical protein